MKKKAPLSVLKKHLRYDPTTGLFWWRVRGPHRQMHKPAGAINGKGYRDIKFQYVCYRANRLAWAFVTGEWPRRQVDHKDHDKKNNTWKNLRLATSRQNRRYSRRPRNNKSGYKGVTWHKRLKKWAAAVCYRGKNRHLGYFSTREAAYAQYRKRARLYYGEFYHGG